MLQTATSLLALVAAALIILFEVREVGRRRKAESKYEELREEFDVCYAALQSKTHAINAATLDLRSASRCINMQRENAVVRDQQIAELERTVELQKAEIKSLKAQQPAQTHRRGDPRDCGEAGHDQGACGTASCLPTAKSKVVRVSFEHDIENGWLVADFPPPYQNRSGNYMKSNTIEDLAKERNLAIQYVGDPQYNPWKQPVDDPTARQHG